MRILREQAKHILFILRCHLGIMVMRLTDNQKVRVRVLVSVTSFSEEDVGMMEWNGGYAPSGGCYQNYGP